MICFLVGYFMIQHLLVLRHILFPGEIFCVSALTDHDISKDMERAAVWSDGDGPGNFIINR